MLIDFIHETETDKIQYETYSYNIFAVLHNDNATQVLDGDYSKCGANYCPQYEVKNSNTSTSDANFEIADSKRYLLFSIYLVLAILGALLIALTVDPLQR